MIITRDNFPRIKENIFRYDWASVTRPTPEDLEEAYTIGRRKQARETHLCNESIMPQRQSGVEVTVGKCSRREGAHDQSRATSSSVENRQGHVRSHRRGARCSRLRGEAASMRASCWRRSRAARSARRRRSRVLAALATPPAPARWPAALLTRGTRPARANRARQPVVRHRADTTFDVTGFRHRSRGASPKRHLCLHRLHRRKPICHRGAPAAVTFQAHDLRRRPALPPAAGYVHAPPPPGAGEPGAHSTCASARPSTWSSASCAPRPTLRPCSRPTCAP